ncbi:membrane protein [Agromyces flavus]|uniref:Membrane protein n=1 Tax=Agromyces flavus TaxID=589382 RepID=A0A1H1UR64_9MICO|nr:YihY/virulence factor BrkB family protein [Agromyces flavus]MCP2368160.1 membrane protein [Agromyces flavus]GGI47620.1 hypothetical protein GCM10010932_23080 [Agromyces flavus]SDS74957.1 membrane protein [Agromyces flavus]
MSERDRGRGDGTPDDASGVPADGASPATSAPESNGRARSPAAEVAESVRERFDEPIAKVTELTYRTMEFFPIRVWRHFLSRNGFLLTAGMSYQSLFAVFAAVYVAFAVAGIWLTSNEETLNALISLINTYAPGLVGPQGIISTEDLQEVATTSTSLFGLTGAVALAGLIWTATDWITYTRLAVRSTFGLPRDDRSYVMLKTRDFLAALAFGITLLVAAVLSIVATTLFESLLRWFGVSGDSGSAIASDTIRAGSLAVVFVIDTLALAVLFRFLSGAAVPWRRMWVGSLLGSAALSVLQLLGGTLVGLATQNPLLATFTVFIGLLLWFRIASIIILVAAAWVAVETADAAESLQLVTDAQRTAQASLARRRADTSERRSEVRAAADALESSPWYQRYQAQRRVSRAKSALADAELAEADAERDLERANAAAGPRGPRPTDPRRASRRKDGGDPGT